MSDAGAACYLEGVRATVRFRVGPDDVRELEPGEIIGRSWTSALCIPDPRVSEAHAMVSLRGTGMKLLALRGRFAVDDRPLTELELVPGQRIELARGLALEVVAVTLPGEVLALEGDGLPRQILSGTSSLRATEGRRPELAPGFQPDADALLFNDGLAWTLRLANAEDRLLVAGDRFAIGERTFRAVAVRLESAGHAATMISGAMHPPLHMVVRYDTVHIHRATEPAVAVDGILARILSELATIGLPVSWEAIAREVWPEDDDLVALRRKWDTSVARLRKKLRDARIRADLIRADGTGNFELFLQRDDKVEDQT